MLQNVYLVALKPPLSVYTLYKVLYTNAVLTMCVEYSLLEEIISTDTPGRKLYILPPQWQTRTVEEALTWATDEILRLDAEIQRLRRKVGQYESRIRTRKNS